MLDKYIRGKVSRISPEAPVPVVLVERESYSAGGAANVANNIADMGGQALIAGVRGEDSSGEMLLQELHKRGINTDCVIVDSTRPTIKKVRILGRDQQLLRVDYEKHDGFDFDTLAKLKRELSKKIESVDAIVISDYAKGIVNREIVSFVMQNSAGKLVIVDPKPRNFQLYHGVSLILPNQGEAFAMAGFDEEDESKLEQVGNKLLSDLGCNVIITRGEKGMSIFNRKLLTVKHIPTKAKEVYDVTGAGDTVAATISLALCAGANLEDAAEIANHAAGIVVGKVGTATVSVEEIMESLQDE